MDGADMAGSLHLWNGEWINSKLANPAGRLQKYLSDGRTTEEVIADFYRRALGRRPTPEEASLWEQELAIGDDVERRRGMEDFLWSLLNCQEFVTNH
jgi:hypothetical protein